MAINSTHSVRFHARSKSIFRDLKSLSMTWSFKVYPFSVAPQQSSSSSTVGLLPLVSHSWGWTCPSTIIIIIYCRFIAPSFPFLGLDVPLNNYSISLHFFTRQLATLLHISTYMTKPPQSASSNAVPNTIKAQTSPQF